jgi:hypothetical protein
LETHITNHEATQLGNFYILYFIFSLKDATKQVLLVHAILKSLCTLLYSAITATKVPSSNPSGWSIQQCEEIQQLALQIFNEFVSDFLDKIEKFPRIVSKLICGELTRNLLEVIPSFSLFSYLSDT